MATWNDYKNHVRKTNAEIGKDIDEIEANSRIRGFQGIRCMSAWLPLRNAAKNCLRPWAGSFRRKVIKISSRQKY